MTKGYKADAAKQGYGQRAAEPVSSDKTKALLKYLTTKQQELEEGSDRDGLTISMLWQSCFRGFNMGELRPSNFKTPTNSPAIPFLVPDLTLQAGSQLHIFPDVTKIAREATAQ